MAVSICQGPKIMRQIYEYIAGDSDGYINNLEANLLTICCFPCKVTFSLRLFFQRVPAVFKNFTMTLYYFYSQS